MYVLNIGIFVHNLYMHIITEKNKYISKHVHTRKMKNAIKQWLSGLHTIKEAEGPYEHCSGTFWFLLLLLLW